MTLPVLSLPTYTLEIPSSKEKIKYTPFTVGQETSLLIAQDSDDIDNITATVKQVLSEVIKSDIDVDSLASFDIEYILLQVRAKSTGEEVEVIFGCDNEECKSNEKARVVIPIDLTTLKVEFKEGTSKNIKLSDEIGIVLKYPSLSTMRELESSDDEIKVIATCVDYIYSAESKWERSDYTEEELKTFLYGLPKTTYEKLQNFFANLPELKHEVTYTCPVCSTKHTRVLKGLNSFFG